MRTRGLARGLFQSVQTDLSIIGASYATVLIVLFFSPYPQVFSGVDTMATGQTSEKSYLFIVTTVLSIPFLGWFWPGTSSVLNRRLWPLFVFLLGILSSVLGALSSTHGDLYVTARNISYLFLVLIPLVVICLRSSPVRGLRIFYAALTLGLLLSVLNVVAIPEWGRHSASDVVQSSHGGLWRGIFIHKNILGQVAVLHTLLTVLVGKYLVPNLAYRAVLLIVGLWTLIAAGSATAQALVLVGIATWLISSLSIWTRAIVALLLMLPCIFIVLSSGDVEQFLVGSIGRDVTFTGRTMVWTWIFERITGNDIIFGRGFCNISELQQELVLAFGRAVVDAHNGYIDLFITAGVIGLIGIVVFMHEVLKTFLLKVGANDPIGRVWGVVFIVWVLNAVTEISPFRPGNALFAAAILSGYYLLTYNRLPNAQKNKL